MKKLLKILTPREIKQSLFLAIIMVVNAGVEMTGIASIAPFLAVLGNRNAIENNSKIGFIYKFFDFHDSRDFIIFLGIAAFVILILSSVFRALVVFIKSHYIQMRRHSLSVRLLKRYLRQPYEYFLKRNSSDLSTAILTEVDITVSSVLAPILDIISYGFITAAILILLFVLNPVIAILISVGFGILYGFFYVKGRHKNMLLGIRRKQARATQSQAIYEILGGVKELKVLGREKAYLDIYEPASLTLARTQVKNQVASDSPRYIVEAIGFCIIFGILLWMLSSGKDLSQILPTIGVYVYAGYRLLPALQSLYAAFTKLRFGKAALDTLYEDLVELKALPEYRDKNLLPFEESLTLENVEYRYPGVERPTLKNISIAIPKGTSFGIIGETGAGKSTLVDLILGLIEPSAGEVLIDGKKLLVSDIRCWQNNIGYIPQHIFLSDDTIASNIAFGIPATDINMSDVQRAAKMAQLNKFIENDLPLQYMTTVGERGVRLSGGQRQRIGIARALYHNPDVVILDEATSALDIETEAEVMKAIESLSGIKTIIMITHRLDTVQRCDQIVTLSRGEIMKVETRDAL